MEASLEDSRARFIAEAAGERKRREDERRNNSLALALQSEARRYLALKNLRERIRDDLGKKIDGFMDTEKSGKTLMSNTEMLKLGLLFVKVGEFPNDNDLLVRLCRHQLISLDSPEKEKNVAALFLGKSTIPQVNRLVSAIFRLVPAALASLSCEKVSEMKAQVSLIHWMTSFSSASSWNLTRQNTQVQAVLSALCDKMVSAMDNDTDHRRLSGLLYRMLTTTRLALPLEAVNALFSLLFRSLRRANFSDSAVDEFILRVLTCPAIILHLGETSVNLLLKEGVFRRVISRLAADGEKRVEERLASEEVEMRGGEPSAALNLLANLVHLSFLDQESLVDLVFDWTSVLTSLFERCSKYAVTSSSKSSRCHWHPILGAFNHKLDSGTIFSLRHVLKQLQMLWSKRIVTCLFSQVLRGPTGKIVVSASADDKLKNSSSSGDLTRSIQKLWRRFNQQLVLDPAKGTGAASASVTPPPLSMTAVLSQLYLTALNTLSNIHNEILSGLNREDFLLPQLWTYLKSVQIPQSSSNQSFPNSELAMYWQLLSVDPSGRLPHFAPLILFCQAAASVISILDEEELYESETPFSVADLAAIAKFCNIFCFRAVWNGYIDEKRADEPLFQCVHFLCSVLYARDSRRTFTQDPKFWLAPDVKSSIIVGELEKKTERAKLLVRRMSHLVSLKERMILFRKYVALDKSHLEDAPPTMITVVRTRIVEDGFRQLAALSTRALKATIRVKFVNQQGLDEAGIDQDGVFKEFLELTLKQVFDPALNLFKVCGGSVLYPSPTSFLQEEHLALFQFVGRMLAKAVYEGIVVDVQLAPVLLATVLGGRRLCAFDELAQLDPDLYKSLSFIKRCKEDVADMALTFSIDTDVFGTVRTHDLVLEGRSIQVDNENKIDYIHRMAHYRVFTETKAQCHAFVHGFQEVLSSNWLFLFAPHELQYLISGQTSDIDLNDLRKHVQYYGGFHSGHRLIKWLWQILENDFSAEERRLFLRFVTSCSRGPLLGFAYLEPPFSIRCVEVSDDQDQGDTLASVVRGFLAIKKSQPQTRLPTASTCFNLLKLPNYSKKSVLLQKLRYAIHSETGFELS